MVRGSFRVMRPSRMTGCHAPIHFSWPTPGQRPPHDIQKKALAEPVVAGEKVHSRREIERHLRRRSHVVKLQVLDHRFPRLQAQSVRPLAPERDATTHARPRHRRQARSIADATLSVIIARRDTPESMYSLGLPTYTSRSNAVSTPTISSSNFPRTKSIPLPLSRMVASWMSSPRSTSTAFPTSSGLSGRSFASRNVRPQTSFSLSRCWSR